MRITKKGSVIQLAFLPALFPVNCYLVEEEDGLTLIDAALPYSGKAILRAVGRLGKPIGRIVLTHAHADHIGALDALKKELPDARVFISARDARLLAGERSLEKNEPQTPVKGGVPKRNSVTTRPDVLLNDGDRIGSLLAVSAPGHTPGSMAFFDTRDRSLIAGDAFQTRGGVAVSGVMKPWFPFPALATWDKDSALASARRLLDLRPTLLAVGHGRMLEAPESAMRQAIAEAEDAWGGRSITKRGGGEHA